MGSSAIRDSWTSQHRYRHSADRQIDAQVGITGIISNPKPSPGPIPGSNPNPGPSNYLEKLKETRTRSTLVMLTHGPYKERMLFFPFTSSKSIN